MCIVAFVADVPSELRLEALQAAVMLLPDENREVLQSLLLFLSDMAEHSAENQVTTAYSMSSAISEKSSAISEMTCVSVK